MLVKLKYNKATEQWRVIRSDTGKTIQEVYDCATLPEFFNFDADKRFEYEISVNCRIVGIKEVRNE